MRISIVRNVFEFSFEKCKRRNTFSEVELDRQTNRARGIDLYRAIERGKQMSVLTFTSILNLEREREREMPNEYRDASVISFVDVHERSTDTHFPSLSLCAILLCLSLSTPK